MFTRLVLSSTVLPSDSPVGDPVMITSSGSVQSPPAPQGGGNGHASNTNPDDQAMDINSNLKMAPLSTRPPSINTNAGDPPVGDQDTDMAASSGFFQSNDEGDPEHLPDSNISLNHDPMGVDNIPSPSAHPSTISPTRPTRRNSKRKHSDRVTDESDTDESDEELSQATPLRRSGRPVKPPKRPTDLTMHSTGHQPNNAKSGSSKRPHASAPLPPTTKYEELPARPVVIGSKYVHFSIFDLTPVKACEILILFPSCWTDDF